MAQLVGFNLRKVENPAIIDTTQQEVFGARGYDENGNVYIYLKGVTSTVAGSWVTYNSNSASGATTLLAADAVGSVAVAMAATNTTSKFGWYMIAGYTAVSASDTVAGAGVPLFIDATAGRVDDAVVTGDLVVGATSTAADTANVLPVVLNYATVTNSLG